MSATLATRVLALLPQTQCRRCTYADCAAYAEAVAQGSAAINQCPPGGALGIERLATLTGQPVLALNPAYGVERPRSVAFIDETWCIGCTLCIKACPTSAIIGSNKLMHTVMESYCTGCELCLPVCPVDCILLEDASASGGAAWSPENARQARQRYEHTLHRHRCDDGANANDRQSRSPSMCAAPGPEPQNVPTASDARKRAAIGAALTRARLKRDSGPGAPGNRPSGRPKED